DTEEDCHPLVRFEAEHHRSLQPCPTRESSDGLPTSRAPRTRHHAGEVTSPSGRVPTAPRANGAPGGIRTHTPFRTMAFEAILSAKFQLRGRPFRLRLDTPHSRRQSPALMPSRLAMTSFMIWSVPAPMR